MVIVPRPQNNKPQPNYKQGNKQTMAVHHRNPVQQSNKQHLQSNNYQPRYSKETNNSYTIVRLADFFKYPFYPIPIRAPQPQLNTAV
jgi:hypothetical protein